MLRLDSFANFEWDRGNLDKSYQKHGIIPNEAEEVFLDERVIIVRDIKHSQKENRFIVIGKTTEKKILFVVFTLRKDTVRIISARPANRKERGKYEQKA
ncbi:BrnT family toxin [Patescibacteria group bacterium]|nr:BrnT family toxin [Patescibacteria group bacterium]MBU2460328.1 BrnT family toxin [Patescibacteria group bacterium]